MGHYRGHFLLICNLDQVILASCFIGPVYYVQFFVCQVQQVLSEFPYLTYPDLYMINVAVDVFG